MNELYLSDNASDVELYHIEMKALLSQLPQTNYSTLKYIMALLVMITKNESVNKMNPLSLGIVFGPSIFRFPIFIVFLIVWNIKS